MRKIAFNRYASDYDHWFLKNENLLTSEVALVAHFLENPGKSLSVGCGSGLFEAILKDEYGITITDGIEPAASMANLAIERGVSVVVGTAEDTDFGKELYDTIIFNGSPSYIDDLQLAFNKAYDALIPGGKIVVLDVPKESSYALLYNLAKELQTWDHPYFNGSTPPNPYPVEFVKESNWRTTTEKIEYLTNCGFSNFKFAQTLTYHPAYSNLVVEEPSEGYTRGDYVAICAIK